MGRTTGKQRMIDTKIKIEYINKNYKWGNINNIEPWTLFKYRGVLYIKLSLMDIIFIPSLNTETYEVEDLPQDEKVKVYPNTKLIIE